MNTSFSVLESIKTAWVNVKGAKGTFWLVLLTLFAVFWIYSLFFNLLFFQIQITPPLRLLFILGDFAMLLLYLCILLGLVYLGICRANEVPITYRMIYFTFRPRLLIKAVALWGVQLLLVLPGVGLALYSRLAPLNPRAMILAYSGLVLLMAGLYFLVRFKLTIAILINEDLGLREALMKSFQLTRFNVLKLIGLYIFNYIIILLSIAVAGIGLFWSLPYLFINYGVVYKRLTQP